MYKNLVGKSSAREYQYIGRKTAEENKTVRARFLNSGRKIGLRMIVKNTACWTWLVRKPPFFWDTKNGYPVFKKNNFSLLPQRVFCIHSRVLICQRYNVIHLRRDEMIREDDDTALSRQRDRDIWIRNKTVIPAVKIARWKRRDPRRWWISLAVGTRTTYRITALPARVLCWNWRTVQIIEFYCPRVMRSWLLPADHRHIWMVNRNLDIRISFSRSQPPTQRMKILFSFSVSIIFLVWRFSLSIFGGCGQQSMGLKNKKANTNDSAIIRLKLSVGYS